MRRLPLAFALLAAGCWESHALPAPPSDGGGCLGAPGQCARAEGCEAWTTRAPDCVDGEWRCAEGERWLSDFPAPVPDGAVCLPHRAASIASVGGFTAAVPVGDACGWIAQFPVTADGRAPTLGLAVPDAPGFGACPSGTWRDLDTDPEPDGAFLSVLDAARLGDDTWVSLRRYRWDPDAGWPGLRVVGSGFARWAPEPARLGGVALPFDAAEDAGDTLARGRDGRLYTLACEGPTELFHEDCRLGRLEGDDPTWRAGWRFVGAGGAYGDWDDAETVFLSGPERSSLRWIPGLARYVHVYAPGFGDAIRIRTAEAPEGPWTNARELVGCDLPADDEEAFCGSPVIRLERMDPRRPAQLAITYDVSTLAPDREARVAADPEAYWPRLVFVTP